MLEPTYARGADALHGTEGRESAKSAVSWPAVIGGALIATAITILLTALGAAIGLSSFSVWSRGDNPTPGAFTMVAAVWLIIVQWASSGLGGYLTGRMRTKWTDAHTDEVFFRDTANGLLTWALASVMVVAFAASSVTSMLTGAAHVAGGAATAAVQTAAASDQRDGMVDTLLRPSTPNANGAPQEARGEIGRILMSATNGSLTPEDHTYLAQLIAARTGISQPDAEKRVDQAIAKENEAINKAKQAAEASRKATSAFLFYSFISMLIGAFIASVAAALGGRERDVSALHISRA